ncbi:MAG: hypothetical protein H6712_24110 [Myxococcales bacterium]|nr:hypothetical protein [Myxococcales bacterium]MCB9716964.1 hypothetical protein [Myxococcales bacterium]
MRRDMDKVLCERPRWGMRTKRRRRYRGPLEDAPRFESSSRHRGGTKALNEHLGPLRRWLRQQAGRPWDAVYGELRANISPRNAVQMHIWQHAEHYVARHVMMIDGKPHHRPGAGWAYLRAEPVSSRRCPVYVCPRTGILRRTPVTPRKRKRAAPTE